MPATAKPRTAGYVAERFELPPGKLRVDRVKGIVYGVRVVGGRSRNGRYYPEAVLRAAAPRFENVAVNVGHHFKQDLSGDVVPTEVPPADRFGRLTNPRFENGGVVADLKFNPRHPFADPFLWAAENDPSMYSLSQLALYRWQRAPDAQGRRVAESLLDVASVDIVTEGGATATIFESADPAAAAVTLETPGQVIAFLTDLFIGLELDQAGKDLVAAAMPAILSAAPGGSNPAFEEKIAAAETAATAESRERSLGDAWDVAYRLPSGPGKAKAMDRLLGRQKALRGKFTAETRRPVFTAEECRDAYLRVMRTGRPKSVAEIVDRMAVGDDPTPPPKPRLKSWKELWAEYPGAEKSVSPAVKRLVAECPTFPR